MASPRGESSNYEVEPLSEESMGQLVDSLEQWTDYLKRYTPSCRDTGGVGRSVEPAQYRIASTGS